MVRTVIWGAGGTGKSVLKKLLADKSNEVVGFIDSASSKWGSTVEGICIYPPHELEKIAFDRVIVGTVIEPYEVKQELLALGVRADKIDVSYASYPFDARIQWLKDFACLFPAEPGQVAEAGVYKGSFAKSINLYFPKKKLYLFDTFEGFDERDLQDDSVSGEVGHLGNTSVQEVLNNMPYPEQVVIKMGYFPDSADGIEEQFFFVNLDMDLYAPTLAGLRFFAPRMTQNGVILVHDYYNENYGSSIGKAIDVFIKENTSSRYKLFPIGDSVSIAIVKCY